MPRRLSLTALAVLALAVVPASASAKSHRSASAKGHHSASARGHRYYLALGDSLSQGMQPNVQGTTLDTDEGYVDDIFSIEKRLIHDLQVVKYGCGGETTSSMITGKGNETNARELHCVKTGGSQLKAAVRFLKAHHHKGEVPLLTLDIGANDVDGCASSSNILGCLSSGENSIKHDLPIIESTLRKAAPKGTRLVMMTLYDPVLAGYFSTNPSTKSLAVASPQLAKQINAQLIADDSQYGFRTADVADAFKTYDSTDTVVWENQTIPVDVAYVCSWTWACTTPPSGPNIHANKNGYLVIAGAFEQVIGRLR